MLWENMKSNKSCLGLESFMIEFEACNGAWGLNSSLTTQMVCMGDYETKPPL